jgi:hypothetical protein
MQTEYAASNSASFGIGTIDTAPRAEKLETSSSRGSPCAQPALSRNPGPPDWGRAATAGRLRRLSNVQQSVRTIALRSANSATTSFLCEAPVQRPYIRETPYRSLSRRRGDDRGHNRASYGVSANSATLAVVSESLIRCAGYGSFGVGLSDLLMNGANRLIGIGRTVVVLCSLEISFIVCKKRSCRAIGCAEIIDAACTSFCAA